MSDDEFISKKKRTDKFIPIITIVIYYGEKAWDGAVSLQGMLDIPEDMKAFINDYKMNLVQVRECIDFRIRNTDIRTVFEIIQMIYERDYKKMNAFIVWRKRIDTELALVEYV